MSYSPFTKNNNKIFLWILLSVVALGLIAAVALFFYFGHAVKTEQRIADFESKLFLSGSFTVEEAMDAYDYDYGWIQSDGIRTEVRVPGENGELLLTDEVLRYDSATRTFSVIGVASGRITFINGMDETVKYEIPFETHFLSADTEELLRECYPHVLADGVVTAGEVDKISEIVLTNRAHVDMGDMPSFANLTKIEIKTPALAQVVTFERFSLPEKARLYVPADRYPEYIEHEDVTVRAHGDRIFPLTSQAQTYSIVLHKDGGVLDADSGWNYETIELDAGQDFNISTLGEIKREGYRFLGWFACTNGGETIGAEITDEYVFTEDVKIYAKWRVYQYTVNLHLNNGTQQIDSKVFDYDMVGPISDTFPTWLGHTHLGWAYEENATTPVFSTQQEVKNLSVTDGTQITLYAVWAVNEYTIIYYNGSVEFDTISGCRYGVTVPLRAYTTPSSSQDPNLGFMGWAFSPDALRADYANGQSVSGLYATPYMNGTVKLYAIYSSDVYTIKYDVNGAAQSQTPADQSNIAKGQAIELARPIERLGHKFLGWQDESGVIYSPYSDYCALDPANRVLLPSDFRLPEGMITSKAEIVLSAVWQPHTFKVAFAQGDANSIYQGLTVTFGCEYSLVGIASKTGHSLTGLKSDVGNVQLNGDERKLTAQMIESLYVALNGNGNNNAFNPESTATFSPVWQVNAYKLTISSSNVSVTVTKTGTKETYISGSMIPYGTSLTITYSAYSGYQNASCTYGSQTIPSGYVCTMPAGNVTLSATATEKPSEGGECIIEGTLVTMADGSQKRVEELAVGDEILVFNHATGMMDRAPIVILYESAARDYEVLKLYFEDGVSVGVFGMHGFFNMDLNKYVQISAKTVDAYIGHRFCYLDAQGEEVVVRDLQLLSYEFVHYDAVSAYSILTAQTINHTANGMLAVSDAIEGLYNVFDLNENMKIDEAKYLADVAEYGLASYEEWRDVLTVEEFEAFNGRYINVAFGKGLATRESILRLIRIYLHPIA